MHDQRLEFEQHNRLFSSSYYYLGLIQVKKEDSYKKKNSKAAEEVEPDWLDSQKDNVYAHDYEMVLRYPS